jgi:Transglutaminase-like superfamily
MGFRLPNHVSFCRIQGATILLDLRRDWYFQLDPALEPTFAELAAGAPQAADAQMLSRLVELGVIEDLHGATTEIVAAAALEPNETWRERAAPQPCPAPFLIEVWMAVGRARTHVRKVAFERLIERQRLRKAKARAAPPPDPQVLAGVAARFDRARRSALIDPICLQDSLALLDVFARRRLYPDLVIGVNTSPFRAHCWVQAGSLVLNQNLDQVSAFHPILVA